MELSLWRLPRGVTAFAIPRFEYVRDQGSDRGGARESDAHGCAEDTFQGNPDGDAEVIEACDQRDRRRAY